MKFEAYKIERLQYMRYYQPKNIVQQETMAKTVKSGDLRGKCTNNYFCQWSASNDAHWYLLSFILSDFFIQILM